ncbi:MAG: penicillin-binding protein 2 [Anaerolineaceae bacterium]|nr:penicillin-binding protein 2 [Anaerolineaceae bacterium]
MTRANPTSSSPILSRIHIFLLFFTVIGVLIVVQMGRVQVMESGRDLVEGFSNTFENSKVIIYPERGKIYDRYGHLLAGNRPIYAISINPVQVKNPETIARTLADVAGFDYQEVFAAATTPHTEESGPFYIPFATRVGPEAIAKIEEIDKEFSNLPAAGNIFRKKEIPPSLAGLDWKVEWVRVYPENDTAGNILGFIPYLDAGMEDSVQPNIRIEGFFNMNPAKVPQIGVEGFYNRDLSGIPRTFVVPFDPNKLKELPEVQKGNDIILTIDREIQREMENILDRAVEKSGSVSGTIVVLDPRNGEILAMAVNPRLDPNNYWDLEKTLPPPQKYNRAISQYYEPGSVFKVLTMAIGLDSGAVQPETEFVDTGSIEIGGIVIRNWDYSAYGPQNMEGCMKYSLNVCLTWVATQVTAERFYPYLKSFGIGRRTRVDLAGEEFSRLFIPNLDTTIANLGTNSFGQGLAVTPLQLASAISAVANDGKIMAPHIAKAIVSNGRQRYIEPVAVSSPISADTAHKLTEMLANSIEEETTSAKVEGYRIAGKTGTAEIYVPETNAYTSSLTNASFVGWGPADDPRFLIYVWLEKPTSSPWGSVVAAPVFQEAASRLVEMLNLPPDDIRLQLHKQN